MYNTVNNWIFFQIVWGVLMKIKKLLKEFIDKYNKLIKNDIFISRKYYSNELSKYFDNLKILSTYKSNSLLNEYCLKNKLNYNLALRALDIYENLQIKIDAHNNDFILSQMTKHKDYLDNILKEDDPNVLLDEEQRRAIINNEDYCLVIAGAGKTTTIAAKVKYLVDILKVDPSKILVISFTNKAVDELKERINNRLKISCPVTTFHACGNAIIRKTQDEKLRVVTEGILYNVIKKYISKTIYKDKIALKNLILFFGYYIDVPFEGDNIEEFFEYKKRSDFTTIKSNLGEINKEIIDSKKKIKITINNEIVNSLEEVMIANFLFIHGIEYEYEKAYPYHIPGATKIYTPDFYITQDGKEYYLEHFGISESGKNSRYSELELEKYKGQIADKKLIHQRHQTNLLYTYSSYNDGKPLLYHLEEILLNAGIKFNQKSDEEIYQKLSEIESNKYFDKLIRLICVFILNYKTKDYGAADFSTLRNNSNNVRTKLFLDVCERVFLEYERNLKESNAVDFQDMINTSTRLLKEIKELKHKLDFEYIIVDEYQDISRQRFNLTKELSAVTEAKIIAVGDDWQSIYAFAGSEIELFTKFKEEMGYADTLRITHTYRNSQELIDIAGKFVQENPSQIRKSLISPKQIKKPIVIVTYSDDYKENKVPGKKGVNEEKARLLEETIGWVIKTIKKPNSSILIIGRYNFDASNLGRTSYFTYSDKEFKSNKYPNLNLSFLTAHSSKGLTYDNVIIINAANEVYGFPAQIENDPVLNLVINNDRSYEFAEERRLFYVALTRTRNRVFILAPKLRPSKFVLELLKYDNVILHGDISKKYVPIKKYDKNCPVCGYPLQLKINKTYGLKLYMCTNDPEICDFITNNIRGGSNSIKICTKCNGGFLIITKQKGEDKFFLGCTNYNDNKGCKNTEPLKFSTYQNVK